MNSNLDSAIRGVPAVVYVAISILLLVLALSWLFLPWTINGHLKRMVKIQQAQLDELERIARNTRPSGLTDTGPSKPSYRAPGIQ